MRRPSLDQLYGEIARCTAVGRHLIRGEGRQPVLVHARAVAVLLMREALGMSWPEIGAELGRSHSTVLELAQSRQHDAQVRRDVRRVSETLDLKSSTA